MENSHLWVSTLLKTKTKENNTMEKEDINQPINWPCDPKADGPRKFTVPNGNYALTAWEVSVSRSKKGNPLLNIKFGINGQNLSKWLYHYITLLPKESKGHGITVHAMKTLGFSVDKSLVNFKPADIIGRVCRAEVVTAEYEKTLTSGTVVMNEKNVISEMLYALPEDKPEMPVRKEETEEVPF